MDKNDPNFSAYMNYDIGCDPIIGDPNMFNPCMQYEQAYMYYRYIVRYFLRYLYGNRRFQV